jgi:hypothetical protein
MSFTITRMSRAAGNRIAQCDLAQGLTGRHAPEGFARLIRQSRHNGSTRNWHALRRGQLAVQQHLRTCEERGVEMFEAKLDGFRVATDTVCGRLISCSGHG